MNQSVLVHLWSIWGLPQIDAFATRFNNRLPRYFSSLPDLSSEAVDALSQKWDRLFLYLFPPFNLIPVVLRKLCQSPSCKCILVFPRRRCECTRMSSPRSLKPPGWNFTLVLHCLSASPFEPLGSILIKFLAWKTAFLTLIL